MQIMEIKESGCSNTLLWAISHGADIKSDRPLISIINNELFYLVTMKDVNFFEVFRLSQMYRDKLRIVNESRAEVPSHDVLNALFPGDHLIDSNDPDSRVKLANSAEIAIVSFINLVQQMEADSDIIQPNVLRLYLPMISRKFDVQIPISFADIIEFMSNDDAKAVFTSDYPHTLSSLTMDQTTNVSHMIQLGFLKGTSIIKYDTRFDQYLNILKYSPLKSCNNDKLYKFGLLGFHKYDVISRGEVRCQLFGISKSSTETGLKRMNRLSTPLEVDFVIQLPIQEMQILANAFSSDILQLSYESSMASILDSGLLYNDFVAPEMQSNNNSSPDEIKAAEEHNNAVSAYQVRLTETNQIAMNTIQLLLSSGNDVDITATFAILPSMYMAKAVITFKESDLKKLTNINDEVISSMFTEIGDVVKKIESDIASAV